MHEGHLHQWDDAYTLYHRPATRFVADFIGHGVFAPATLKRVGNQVVVHTALGALTDGAECPLPTAFAWGQCEVLLRADDIVHDDEAPVKAEIVQGRGSEFHPCAWPPAKCCWPTCPATTITAWAMDGIAQWTTWSRSSGKAGGGAPIALFPAEAGWRCHSGAAHRPHGPVTGS
jgi:hypothetical protein